MNRFCCPPFGGFPTALALLPPLLAATAAATRPPPPEPPTRGYTPPPIFPLEPEEPFKQNADELRTPPLLIPLPLTPELARRGKLLTWEVPAEEEEDTAAVDHVKFRMSSFAPVNFGHVRGADSPSATRVLTTAGMLFSSRRSVLR